jgi:hypothetical protein
MATYPLLPAVPEDGFENDVDDVDAPNTYPYKKCTSCGDRKSCGSYDEDKQWLCENCYARYENGECEGCEIVLTEDIYYDCLEKKNGEDMVVCRICWNENKKELKEEGWIRKDEINDPSDDEND